ncbi:MAG TPA: DUF2784 domain-containing protein [Candidatus Manganitrophaceae bacterium]
MSDFFANFVIFIHFVWILFLIFGALAGIYIRWIRYLHLSALFFALIVQFVLKICPLTELEKKIGGDYPGGFIFHYLEKLIYLPVSEQTIQRLTVLLVGWSLAVYVLGARLRRRRATHPPSPTGRRKHRRT